MALGIEASLHVSCWAAPEPMGTEPTWMEICNVETKKSGEKKRLTNEEHSLVRKKACFICKKK